jgi:hypothetical protein
MVYQNTYQHCISLSQDALNDIVKSKTTLSIGRTVTIKIEEDPNPT